MPVSRRTAYQSEGWRAPGPQRVRDGQKHPRAVGLLHASIEDFPRLGAQRDRFEAGLAVSELQPVSLHLLVAQADDLLLAAAGQQQQADDGGL